MANNCVLYTTTRTTAPTTEEEEEEEQNQNGLTTSSSMGMVYADMGSLSLTPNYRSLVSSSVSKSCSEVVVVENGRAAAFWGLPLNMGNCIVPRSFEEHQSSARGEVISMEGKGCESSDGVVGENKALCEEHENHSSAPENNNNNNNNNTNNNGVNGKETDSGQSKLCARGHWRPAEDAKLKELVALYGPQNWNLIAEKLEGRSGKFNLNPHPPHPPQKK